MKKVLSVLLAAALTAASLSVGAAVAAEGGTVTEYLEFSFQNQSSKEALSTGGDAARSYPVISKKEYTFKKGDKLCYDIKLVKGARDQDYSAFGSVDAVIDPGVRDPLSNKPNDVKALRDSAAFVDQNGVSGHSKSNLYPYANQTWYHREIILSDDLAGQKTTQWTLAEDVRHTDACTVQVANIVVKSKDGSEFVIFKTASDLQYEANTITKDNLVASSTVAAKSGAAQASDARLSGTAVGSVKDYVGLDADVIRRTARFYVPFSDKSYTFQEGDVLVYDVFASNSLVGVGGLDCFPKDVGDLDHNSDKGIIGSSSAVDQNGVKADPASDLSKYCGTKWYHREIAIGSDVVGKTASVWAVAVDTPDNILDTDQKKGPFISTVNVKVKYGNIYIRHKDGSEEYIFKNTSYFKEFESTPKYPLGAIINNMQMGGRLYIRAASYASTPVTFAYTEKKPATPPATTTTTRPPVTTAPPASNGGQTTAAPEKKQDVLQMDIQNKATNDNGTYPIISVQGYTFKEGDYLEYDVYLEVPDNGKNYRIGGVDAILYDPVTIDGEEGVRRETNNLRTSPVFVDQNNIRGNVTANAIDPYPSGDISSKANGQWYHRKLAIPADFVGVDVMAWNLYQAAPSTEKLTAKFANIVITNDGKEQLAIFKKAEDFVSYESTVAPGPNGSSKVRAFRADGTEYEPQPGEIVPPSKEETSTAASSDDSRAESTVGQPGGSDGGALTVILIVVGVVVVLAAAGVVAFVLVRRKKAQGPSDPKDPQGPQDPTAPDASDAEDKQ